jgi:ATP-dependent NAD(P)H-hydrate dehydratase
LVSKALGGVTVLQKGAEDIIATNIKGVLEVDTITKVDTLGGFKRVGGQGDILSGCTATWLAWGKCYETGVFG